jgi:hypothetical protein
MKFKFIKKAAMFGLGARIKKLCHAGLDPVSHEVNNKHAAMFGLDARIALAIFGALSVISGAALYSAIKQAKVTAFAADIKELAKAVEHASLDVVTDFPVAGGDQLEIHNLVYDKSSLSGWNGPYISGYTSNDVINERALLNSKYHRVFLLKFQYHNPDGSRVACAAGEPCYLWIHFTGVPDAEAKSIDEYFDGAFNLSEGVIQGADYNSIIAGTDTISYKVMPSFSK